MKHTTLALLALGTSACLGMDGEDISSVEQEAGGGCPAFMCGSDSNSPVIDMFNFHDLKNPHPSAGGPAENAGGFTLVGLHHGGTFYDNVFVNNSVLMASTHGGKTRVSHPVGGYLRLKHNKGSEFLIYIKESDAVPYWADNGSGAMTPTYFIKWLVAPADGSVPKTESKEWPNVCSNPIVDNPSETLGMNGMHVVLFEGDRIDSTTIAWGVGGTDEDKTWFNIGCAGHALAKLHLSGYTYVTNNVGYPTVTKDRQTFLKMITADYCGIGRPFTVAGQPLNWADKPTYLKYADDPFISLEARWGPGGATCLDKPRVDANPTPNAWEVWVPQGWSNLEEAIEKECPMGRPVACKNPDVYDFDHLVLSANPS